MRVSAHLPLLPAFTSHLPAFTSHRHVQVRDTGIFRAHAAKYEAEFLEDMTKLGEAPHTAAMR